MHLGEFKMKYNFIITDVNVNIMQLDVFYLLLKTKKINSTNMHDYRYFYNLRMAIRWSKNGFENLVQIIWNVEELTKHCLDLIEKFPQHIFIFINTNPDTQIAKSLMMKKENNLLVLNYLQLKKENIDYVFK